MDILKKVAVLVAILSVSMFMTGCSSDSADGDGGDDAPAAGSPPGPGNVPRQGPGRG